MVAKPTLPQINWEEDFTLCDERRVSEQIMTTITSTLAPLPQGDSRLFFFVPTPAPYSAAQDKLLLALEAGGVTEKKRRVLSLPHGGRCYVLSSESGFLTLLAHAFHLGPPELTFIGANCHFNIGGDDGEDMVNFVLAALKQAPQSRQDIVGLHFDSGTLVELF
ncbi:hypothetical protein [Thalassomonas actiniarum]|uniref:Uncharacterized protein n=1 Tax=Thalassomonas actiniarum TaxID=485447 RepID=A0AAF0C528_9GAMM|nr:hypothetical protein [Thalassomonas actiniarum]WDE00629.1 hypothetical protein SG35_008340 [Thalassomonas actiniarum]